MRLLTLLSGLKRGFLGVLKPVAPCGRTVQGQLVSLRSFDLKMRLKRAAPSWICEEDYLAGEPLCSLSLFPSLSDRKPSSGRGESPVG